MKNRKWHHVKAKLGPFIQITEERQQQNSFNCSIILFRHTSFPLSPSLPSCPPSPFLPSWWNPFLSAAKESKCPKPLSQSPSVCLSPFSKCPCMCMCVCGRVEKARQESESSAWWEKTTEKKGECLFCPTLSLDFVLVPLEDEVVNITQSLEGNDAADWSTDLYPANLCVYCGSTALSLVCAPLCVCRQWGTECVES